MTSNAAELFWRRGIGAVALFRQIKVSPRFGELTMQCPHCAHPDYICCSTSRGVQRYRCQACWRIFKSLRRGKESSPQAKVLSALSSLSRRDGVASYWQIPLADTSASIIDGHSLVGASRPSTPMASDQAPADCGRWHGHAAGLRKFHSTRQALRRKDLHHTNRITQLPTRALSSKAPS